MKKIIFNIIFVGLIFVMILPFCVSAKNISTLETSENNGKITISGTTENGVLAIATLVYSGDDLIYMETCEANGNSYSCTLNNIFAKGNYVVKVADYDGGNYVIDNIIISGNNETGSNPQTGDKIMSSIIIGSISLIGLLAIGLYTKNKKFN